MDCANDKAVRLVVLMWASQTTKTTCIENVAAFHIAADAAPILMVQPTVEMAQAWSKERFNVTVRDTPVLRDIISDPKSRESSNTIQLKLFPGGNLAIIGANAPAGLAGRSRRVVLLDEVDRFPLSAGTEGDPVALAIKRTESFNNAVVFLTSTPTVKGASRIESEYEQTDKRQWFVPCPSCGQEQSLKWSQVKWPKDEHGGHLPELAYYECEHCNGRWNDDLRRKAIAAGKWKSTAPFKGKRGYFLNGIYSPFKAKRGFKSRLHQMAVEFLEAKAGGAEQLKTWTNTFLAETWEESSEKLDMPQLMERAEDYSEEKIPNGIIIVVGAGDVQADRIEVEWLGVGLHDETWGIARDKVFGDTEKPDVWQQLSMRLHRSFTRADGVVIRPWAFALDIHFKPKNARLWCAKSGLDFPVFPVIGTGQQQAGLVKDHFNKFYGQRTWSIATDAAKDIIFSRLKISEPGPRYCHFPRHYSDEFYIQLASESVVTRFQHGFPKRIYQKSSGARNEALDIRVYQLAALDIRPPNLPAIAAGQAAGPKPPAQKPQRTDSWMAGIKRTGWV